MSGNIGNSQSLNRYCYVQGNPVSLTDPFGLCPTRAEVYKNRALKWLHNALDLGGFFFDGFDFANVLLYHFEGRDTEAAITLLCLILGMGNFLALSVRLTLKEGTILGRIGNKYGRFVDLPIHRRRCLLLDREQIHQFIKNIELLKIYLEYNRLR